MAETWIKRIELAIRGRYNRWVSRGGDPSVISEPCATSVVEAHARILLLRQDRIGDVLVSTPIIAAIRRRFPDATIGMVLSTNNSSVAYTVEPFVDRIHVFRKSLLDLIRLRREIRACSYDVVIDLMDNPSSTSGLLIQGSRAPLAIGVDKENRRIYTHVVPLADRTTVHIVERIARVTWPLGFAISHDHLRPLIPGVDPRDEQSDLRAPDRTYMLGVNVSGSDAGRMYPEEQLTDVLRAVQHVFGKVAPAGRLRVVIMSAPHHHNIAARVATVCGADLLPPMPSFRDFAQAIGECDMFFTPDTSAVHVAAAWNIPSMVLYAQDDRMLLPWYPYDTRCWRCIARNAPLSAISTEEVGRVLTSMVHEITGMNPDPS